jgi:hypothetical protein
VALFGRVRAWNYSADTARSGRSNKGVPGVDGQDFADIEAYGVERWLAELAWLSIVARLTEPIGPENLRMRPTLGSC